MLQSFFIAITSGFATWKDIAQVVIIPLSVVGLGHWIARRWQNKQRDFATRRELVEDISKTIMTVVMTVYMSRNLCNTSSSTEENVDDQLSAVYKEWRVHACVIGSKLHAYYPDEKRGADELHERWNRYAESVTEFFDEYRVKKDYQDKKKLDDRKKALFDEKAVIVARVLRDELTGFQPRFQKKTASKKQILPAKDPDAEANETEKLQIKKTAETL